MENRPGLAVGTTLTHATGMAEREATLTMLDRRKPRQRITLGADKAHEVTDFAGDLHARNLPPHVAVNGTVPNLGRVRKAAIDAATRRTDGYAISQRCHKRIAEIHRWIKAAAGFASGEIRGKPQLNATFTRPVAACNLIGIPKLPARPAT